jgi:hypothetical protein
MAARDGIKVVVHIGTPGCLPMIPYTRCAGIGRAITAQQAVVVAPGCKSADIKGRTESIRKQI